jgi:hypothetical protein
MKPLKEFNESNDHRLLSNDIIMTFVNKDIATKEELAECPKGDLVRMLYSIAKRVEYFEFVEEHKPFIN